MSLRSTLGSGLYRFGQLLNVGPIRKAGEATRLDALYVRSLASLVDTYTVEVGGVSAEFLVDTRAELFHLHRNTGSEAEVVRRLLSDLRADDVFFDVGANVGVYSCLAAKVTDESVVAVEPYRKNATKVTANARLNGVDVDVRQVALAATNGTRSFRVDDRAVAGAGRGSLASTGGDGSLVVETVRGDDLVENRRGPPPTVLKIDVEGTEIAVLDGFEEALSRESCRLVFCEVHPRQVDPRVVRERLEAHGFAVTPVGDARRIHLRAAKE